MDQLCQVFNGIDIVVGRRRDQLNAGGGLPHPADILVNLVARQLSALAGFGALGHLDLQVGCVDQVVGGHTEPARGHLLDGAAAGVAVLVQLVAPVVLSALAGVAAGAHAVHGDGHRLVRFPADGTQGRRAGGKPLGNLRGWLNLFDGHRGPVLIKGQQAAQRGQFPSLVVGEPGEFFVNFPVVRLRRMLQFCDGVRVPLMVFLAPPPLVGAAHGQVLFRGDVG